MAVTHLTYRDVMDVAATRATVRPVAYGRPATVALAEAIAAAKQRHPLDPVTVVVASNLAGLSVRRLIGGGTVGDGGLANVSFVTPFRLAELVGGDAVGGYPLTNAVLAAAARSVLRDDPGWFGSVAEHPASETALVALYGELSHVRPGTLASLAARTPRGAEMVRLFRAVRARLTGVHDEDDLARAATQRLRTGTTPAAPIGHLIWFLPDRLTPAMSDLLAAAIAAAPVATVVVGLTGEAGADAAVRRTLVAAGVGLAEVDAATVTPPTGTRIVSVSDPEEEVRAVCREIAALAEAGTPLDRIGVFHPAPDPYARTVHEHLLSAGIPHNGPSRLRLADRVAGRTLLAVLGLPERGWSRAAVVALASDAPLRHDGAPVPVTVWERLSRDAGVVGGLDDWSKKLAALAVARRDQYTTGSADPEVARWALTQLRSDAERAEQLTAFVAGLEVDLEAIDQAHGWAGKVRATQGLLVRLLGSEGRRVNWPDDERDAGERVDAALARLELLDEIDPLPTTAAFVRAVAAELDEPAGRIGRFGDGVVFGPLAMAPGLDLDAVFVVGMAEGTCPNPSGEDALLPDDDRAATGGDLTGRDERLHDQHRMLLAALASGGTQRVLVFPRGDLRGGRTRLPSRWLLDTATARHGARVHSSAFAALGAPAVDEVPSFTAGLLRAPAAASLADRDLATLNAYLLAGGRPADHPSAGPALRRGLEATGARRSDRFTEWDGNLAGMPVPSPAAGKRLSATAMQSWAMCGFRYFLGQVLKLGERAEPETITEISAADRGTLIHTILERFVDGALRRPEGPPEPGEPWTAADREQLQTIAGEVFAETEAKGITGRPLHWRLQQEFVRSDLDAFLDHDLRLRTEAHARPRHVELAFGLDDAPPLTLDLDGRRTLAFRGRIDRVDQTDTGGHVVYDYKSGAGKAYKDLAKDPVLAGASLQLGLYAEAVRQRLGGQQVASYYWMITDAGGFVPYGYDWTPDVRRRFVDVLSAITDGIEAGTFPMNPGEFNIFFGKHQNCRYCPFDALCPRDRDDQELAKAGAPELAVRERLRPPSPDTTGPGTDAGVASA